MVAGEVDVLASFGLHHTYKRWENAMFVDLTDKVAELGIDLIANWGSDAYTYDGSVYTFPCGGLGHYVAINMTDWNEAGLGELPTEWTWDEYLAASAAMTKGEGETKVYGGADYSSIEYFTWPWYQVYGKDNLYNEEGKSNLTDPLIINALKREIKAEQEDGIWFPLVTFRADNIKAADAFQNHNVASIIVCNLVRYLNPETATWITRKRARPTTSPVSRSSLTWVSPPSAKSRKLPGPSLPSMPPTAPSTWSRPATPPPGRAPIPPA